MIKWERLTKKQRLKILRKFAVSRRESYEIYTPHLSGLPDELKYDIKSYLKNKKLKEVV